MKYSQRIGIFGGSFDPPHAGHLIIAELTLEQLQLDRIIFVPAYVPPHKQASYPSTALDRLRMTTLALQNNPEFFVSDIEIRRKGVSYTIDTIHQFRRLYPSAKLYLIIGGDNLRHFDSWKDPQEILGLASLVVYKRPSARKTKGRSSLRKFRVIKGPMLDISSSLIRQRVSQKKSIRYLVPQTVGRYIAAHRLYRRP